MWHRWFPRVCGWFFFSRLVVRNAPPSGEGGPILWLGLHRNGAVDGFVYAAGLRRPMVYLISTQLRKNALARLFFGGIAVARTAAEGEREANRAALEECQALLRGGGELFIFPEGTSTLGPRHLPFKAGAAQVTLDYLDAAGSARIAVRPVGVHYREPWAFRSAVEIVVGPPVELELPAGLAALGRLRELKRRFTEALEAVGANFPDATAQREAEALATLAELHGGASRGAILKAAERGELAVAIAAWRELDTAANARGAARYAGVPLLATGAGIARELGVLLVPGAMVLAGIAANAPPFFAAAWAGKKFPDDTNVIALWKILVGVPLFAGWLTVACIALGLAWGAVGSLGYLALTAAAWLGYDRVRRAFVMTRNGLLHAPLRDRFAAVVAHVARCP